MDEFTLFDPEEYLSRDIEPIGEMATVGTSNKPALRIQINPDRGRKGNPYFKAFNNTKLVKGTKVARLHFLDTGMEYHRDEFFDWIPSNKEIEQIRNFLQDAHYDFPQYSNWQMACWLWNMEYEFIDPRDKRDYFDGKFDDEFKDHPSYVPSNTPIPETWIYNPPK